MTDYSDTVSRGFVSMCRIEVPSVSLITGYAQLCRLDQRREAQDRDVIDLEIGATREDAF